MSALGSQAAIAVLCKNLLPPSQQTTHTDKLHCVQIMLKVFGNNGLEPVECDVGQAFDPNVHNAMFELPTAEVEQGKIGAVVKRGYTLKGRVIRATDVGIARPVEG